MNNEISHDFFIQITQFSFIIFHFYNDVMYIDSDAIRKSSIMGVWAIIVGLIVAGKLTYRWYATIRLAKDNEKINKQ